MRLQRTPIDPTQPFSRADARAAGIKIHDLITARYRRVFHDVYLSSTVKLTIAKRASAATAAGGPGSYASHVTAASIWGAVAPFSDHVHICVPDGTPRCERRGVRAHRARAGVVTAHKSGVLVSGPIDCLLEMAADGVGLVDLIVAGDSMLKLGLFTRHALRSAASHWVGRGIKLARRAVGLMREGVDSPMESRLRLLLVLAGFPEPLVNHVVRHPDGSWCWRFDLCYPGLLLIIEYDGRQHAESLAQWKRDVRRRENLDRLGWRLIVIQTSDIYENPGETLDRIADVFRELGGTLRRVYRPEWSRHFPSRAVSIA